MKTTETKQEQKNQVIIPNMGRVRSVLTSARPTKSMVRIKSLRPQRIGVAIKASKKVKAQA